MAMFGSYNVTESVYVVCKYINWIYKSVGYINLNHALLQFVYNFS